MIPAVEDVFDKYFGIGFSQDHLRLHVVRVYCSAIMQTDGWEILSSHVGEDRMRSILDDEDYAIWLSLTSELRGK